MHAVVATRGAQKYTEFILLVWLWPIRHGLFPAGGGLTDHTLRPETCDVKPELCESETQSGSFRSLITQQDEDAELASAVGRCANVLANLASRTMFPVEFKTFAASGPLCCLQHAEALLPIQDCWLRCVSRLTYQ